MEITSFVGLFRFRYFVRNNNIRELDTKDGRAFAKPNLRYKRLVVQINGELLKLNNPE